ncbi:hypothetical protein EDB92DRAFT_1818811 [Lactarius akahatsu]|uniref:Uncharacterized protein n=1 Tax=Lactarius akahatsu TaxID=416441 RepID=A0AAD4LBN8_9AGAM|nr:hypothetical protein EDB92DRAFT_1818811 [Lactarius akahatsu]
MAGALVRCEGDGRRPLQATILWCNATTGVLSTTCTSASQRDWIGVSQLGLSTGVNKYHLVSQGHKDNSGDQGSSKEASESKDSSTKGVFKVQIHGAILRYWPQRASEEV